MIVGGVGGANTKTGARFEENTSLADFLNSQKDYEVREDDFINGKSAATVSRWAVYFRGTKIADIFQKFGLYRYFDEIGYDYSRVLSKKLLPDDSIFVFAKNTIYVIEKKYQSGAGSVDEKPQTCAFKLYEYRRLFAPLNREVEFMYLFNDWFMKPEYRDMLDWIIAIGCSYYFNYIPLEKLGLPVAK